MVKKYQRWEQMDKGNISLEKLILQFEAFNRSEGKTAKTIEWYNQSLKQFHEFLIDDDYSTLLGDLDLNLIRTYILYMQKRPRFVGHPFIEEQEVGLSPTSVENHVRALRAFFNWLHREGYTPEPVLAKLRPPRVPRKLVEPLNDVEIAAIFSAIDANTLAGARDVCMVTLMLDTGLRSNEVVTLITKDVHLENGYLKRPERTYRSLRQLVAKVSHEVSLPLPP